MLKGILRQLWDNFLQTYRYPVILFHEPNFSSVLQEQLRNLIPEMKELLHFQLVQFQV